MGLCLEGTEKEEARKKEEETNVHSGVIIVTVCASLYNIKTFFHGGIELMAFIEVNLTNNNLFSQQI